jgi:hypothetical protein
MISVTVTPPLCIIMINFKFYRDLCLLLVVLRLLLLLVCASRPAGCTSGRHLTLWSFDDRSYSHLIHVLAKSVDLTPEGTKHIALGRKDWQWSLWYTHDHISRHLIRDTRWVIIPFLPPSLVCYRSIGWQKGCVLPIPSFRPCVERWLKRTETRLWPNFEGGARE